MSRILVIEDDPKIRKVLRKLLEREGHDVEEASDGLEGLRLYRKKPADLVITDIIMPRKEGLETILDLRREFPDVKIIAISGGGRLGPHLYLEVAEGFGAFRVFSKPFDLEELQGAILELLGEEPRREGENN
ncbi:MAG: response regulator [Deltaproteobacteria bacterium]|nr:response regulator [Deltaproteobacteria bacterium]